jgi:hypothetical protein
MSLLQCEESLFFSSDEANGALNKSSDGSTFSVQLNNPIAIPKEAIYCTLEVTAATIWNNSPNISTAIGNNTLSFEYLAASHTITIPDGLYGIDELATRIQREIVALGLPADMFVFSADDSTQKVIVSFTYANTRLDFTQPNSCRVILGFDARDAPVFSQPAGYSEESDTTANFNRVNNYLIKSDIISNGISVNAISDSIIADILITSSPGDQIVYTPYNPPRANADELINHSKSSLTFRLTDQVGRPAETLGENWGFTCVLRYVLKV